MNFLSPISLKKAFCKTGLTLLILLLFSTSRAQQDDTLPANIICRVTKYINWPHYITSSGNFVTGVLEDSSHLKPAINKKNIETRDLKIASELLQLGIPVKDCD